MLDLASLKSVSQGKVDGIPTPSDDRKGTTRKEEDIPLITKSTSADQGTIMMGNRCHKGETASEKRMETDSPPNEKKE
jgi:hypothetical protein